MPLDIVQTVLREYAGGHVPVLDPLIGKNGGCQILPQLHLGKPFIIQFRNLVVAFPQGLGFFIGQTLNGFFQFFRLFQENRKRFPGKTVIRNHLFRRGDDDLHYTSSSIRSGFSAALTFPMAFMMIPFSSMR